MSIPAPKATRPGCWRRITAVKCGIYLQDNTADWGGGVDIVRGGHRFPLRTGNHRVDFGTKTLANHVRIVTAWQRMELKAGDFLAFDSRLPHRSTLPERGITPPQPKYVIYWDSCRTAYAGPFIADRARRGAQEIAGGELLFAQMASLSFPHRLPAGIRRARGRGRHPRRLGGACNGAHAARALSAHMPAELARAALLDRDGTINVEREYLSDPAGVELLPNAVAGLRRLRALGYGLIVISNQSGVARGYFTMADVDAVNARLTALLREQGVTLDGVYVCPHAPDAGCACRKPAPGLIQQAAREHGFDPRASVMIGDKAIDIETGRQVGARTVLVRTGYGREFEARGDVRADHVADDLLDAANILAAPMSETVARARG